MFKFNYYIIKPLVNNLTRHNVIAPRLLTVRKGDDRLIKDCVMAPVLAGTKLKQGDIPVFVREAFNQNLLNM